MLNALSNDTALEMASHVARQLDLSLLELSQNGLFILSGERRLLYVNRAFAEMLGYEPRELYGTCGQGLVDENDRPLVSRALDTPWRPGERREVQVRMRMKHGMGLRHVVIRQGRIRHAGRDAFIGSVRDVTDLHRGEQALKDYAKRLRRMSQQLLDVQENERRNLARELHDEIGQQLTFVKLSLTQLTMQDSCGQPVREALDVVAALMEQVRSLSLDLRPSMLDDLGLDATLRWYIGRIGRLASLDVRLEIDADFPRLAPDIETLFFRIAQEAATNVIRHAGARSMFVKLGECGRGIELRISDDGRGFDVDTARCAGICGKSAGLLGMQERAALKGAELALDSRPGSGTTLRLIMPGMARRHTANST